MPPRQPGTEPPAPPAPPAPPPGDQAGGQGKPVDDRLSALEQHSEKQDATLEQHGGMLQQILDRLPGKAPSSGSSADPDPDEGKPIGQLVREGVEKLEAEKAAKKQADDEAAERADHAARLKKLEETKPREVAATPAGRFRAAVQKYGFGIEDTRR